MDIKWQLRELAWDARVTVSELLIEAGVSWATVSRWYKGGRRRYSTWARILSAAERLKR
jgi:DNA-binding LacI/PurR family transcriptional regulator